MRTDLQLALRGPMAAFTDLYQQITTINSPNSPYTHMCWMRRLRWFVKWTLSLIYLTQYPPLNAQGEP